MATKNRKEEDDVCFSKLCSTTQPFPGISFTAYKGVPVTVIIVVVRRCD